MIRVIIIIVLASAALIFGLSAYLQPNDLSLCPADGKPAEREGCQPADAIIAISGGDTEARTRHAIELFQNGWASTIIFSGAAQDTSGPSNAQVMKGLAIRAGIPARSILIEETSRNTQQNAANTNQLLQQHDISTVILVTSGYHQRRASLEFHKLLDSNISIRNSPTDDKDWGWWWWLSPRGWWLAGGEMVKIIAFYTGVAS